jgi:hypothetical protein
LCMCEVEITSQRPYLIDPGDNPCRGLANAIVDGLVGDVARLVRAGEEGSLHFLRTRMERIRVARLDRVHGRVSVAVCTGDERREPRGDYG